MAEPFNFLVTACLVTLGNVVRSGVMIPAKITCNVCSCQYTPRCPNCYDSTNLYQFLMPPVDSKKMINEIIEMGFVEAREDGLLRMTETWKEIRRKERHVDSRNPTQG